MISISYNWHGNFDARATVCAVSDRFFLAHAHFRQISTSSGSSGDGFQITDPISYSSLIVNRDMDMSTNDDRRNTPLLIFKLA